MKIPMISAIGVSLRTGAMLFGSLPGVAFAQSASTPPEAVLPAPIIRAIVVTGTKGVKNESVRAAVAAVAGNKPGNDTTLRAVAQAVTDLYRKRGFSIAQVIATEVSPDGTLTVVVAEGTIRRVIVRGNTKTPAKVIRTAVDVQPGDLYKEDAVRDARNRLARLGIFEDVIVVGALDSEEKKVNEEKDTNEKEDAASKDASPAPNPPTAPSEKSTEPDSTSLTNEPVPDEVGYVDLIVRVKERRTGNIAATVGFNEGTGLIGFVDFSEDNVYGTANRASVQWQRTNTSRFTSNGDFIEGRTRSAYLVSYDVPALGPHSTAFGAEVYNTNTVFLPFFSSNQDNLRNYELRKGGKARIGRALGRSGTLYLTARRDDVGYDPIPDSLSPPVADLFNANATVAALGMNLILDGRDDAINPRRGFLHNISFERAGTYFGGTRAYTGVTADLRAYAPVGSRAQSPILAFRVMGGTVGDNAPLSEQFWLGGYDLLRGYDLYSIRGSRMLLTSTELRVPLGPGFQGVAFVDLGNAFQPGQSAGISKLKGSGGLGLRFLTPIGPIRFDVAYGNQVQTYVSLGQSY